MAKGYGNVGSRFAKYFARHKNSAGAHDPKNAKQQALEKVEVSEIDGLDETYQDFSTVDFGVGDIVRVVAPDSPWDGDEGRVTFRLLHRDGISFAVSFAVGRVPETVYFEANELERV